MLFSQFVPLSPSTTVSTSLFSVSEPRAYNTKWSKSERERQVLCIKYCIQVLYTCIWNLERWYWWSLLDFASSSFFPKFGLVKTTEMNLLAALEAGCPRSRHQQGWQLSRVWLFVTLWTVALQAPLSMGFSRQEYWVLLCPSPGDLPDLGIEPVSLVSPALAGGFFTTSTTWKGLQYIHLGREWGVRGQTQFHA